MPKFKRAGRRSPPAWRDFALALRRSQRALNARLLGFVTQHWGGWIQQMQPAIQHLKQDAASDDIKAGLGRLTLEFERDHSSTTQRAAAQQASRVNAKNRTAANASTKTLLGIEPFGQDPWAQDFLDLFVDNNVGMIKSISETQAQQVGRIVRENLLAGVSLRNTTQEIIDRGGIAERQAQFLARDQTAKLNAQLTQARFSKAGIDQYQWSTSKDERVRENHASKEGNIYSFADPPADTGNPGEDYNCRCVAIPVIED